MPRFWCSGGGLRAVIREVAEETGYEAGVERLLGVDRRVIAGADRRPGLPRR
jgi:8-oxo-dGTP pyrophosphatase MutT (NUDIX family)